jgi:hypothetical protein
MMTLFMWIIRGVMIIAGSVASWLVTRDSEQFGIMEMAVALLLMIFILAVLAFWPERWTLFLNRLYKRARIAAPSRRPHR